MYLFIEISEITTSGITMMTIVIIRRRTVKIEGVRNRDRTRTCGEGMREREPQCNSVAGSSSVAATFPVWFMLAAASDVYKSVGGGVLANLYRRFVVYMYINTPYTRIHKYYVPGVEKKVNIYTIFSEHADRPTTTTKTTNRSTAEESLLSCEIRNAIHLKPAPLMHII